MSHLVLPLLQGCELLLEVADGLLEVLQVHPGDPHISGANRVLLLFMLRILQNFLLPKTS